jgi:hypothetical protein
MPERRFPSPWSFEELDACFVVTDSAGEKLAYVYFEGYSPEEFSKLAANCFRSPVISK